jgi:hypothetical protein
MAKVKPIDVVRLKSAPALMSHAEHDQLIARLDGLRNRFASAATFALEPGTTALVYLGADREAAVAAARAIDPAREAARVLRRLATLYEIGAARAEVAICTRADCAAVLSEAAREA